MAKLSSGQKKIVAVLKEEKRKMTADEILEKVNADGTLFSKKQMTDIIYQLIDFGFIIKKRVKFRIYYELDIVYMEDAYVRYIFEL